MAAGVMRKVAGDSVDVYSAGTNSGSEVDELSADALAEIGIDISEESPKSIDPELLRDVDVPYPSAGKPASGRSPEPTVTAWHTVSAACSTNWA
jgi:arsenate-mycothiol transferase